MFKGKSRFAKKKASVSLASRTATSTSIDLCGTSSSLLVLLWSSSAKTFEHCENYVDGPLPFIRLDVSKLLVSKLAVSYSSLMT